MLMTNTCSLPDVTTPDSKTRAVATIDKKAGEAAILSLAESLEVPLIIISRKMIGKLDFETVMLDEGFGALSDRIGAVWLYG